ncbi:peptidoglycan-N-acetylglucosamine deacetylase [Entomortierella parvispora]|uniref:chitin deacetylase n=1 Tax=Entomortierella parvispora TaxID=205924 RepID=A0A9P3H6K3_9FUNG|nr:peptidoglycan-N-acetylglucosamine deacetylase [Entomortierella parvispora]
MVKVVSSLLAISATLSVALAIVCPEYKALDPGEYPSLDCVPYTQDPQVQTWLKLVDMTKVPVYPQSNATAGCPDLATIDPNRCWWTCQKCEAPTDITTCPTTGTWGLTYDDGPSEDSIRLYDYLLAKKQKATLFVVGSRVISRKEILQRAYKEGHHIAIHTWSHSAMTSLTNEQIVAELKWTEKAIFDAIGVTPLYWRPPYGDVDNRVRAIATQLGYKTAIWTQDFDTDDWHIPDSATPQSVVDTFKSWLVKIPTMQTGFIVLEHDLLPAEVNVSITGILPIAYGTPGLTIVPIAQCRGDAAPYKEGAGTFVLTGPATPQPSVSGTVPAGPGASATGTGHTGGPTIISNGAIYLTAASTPLSLIVAAVAFISNAL